MGKIVDMVSTKAKDARYFLGQHIKSQQHRRLLAERESSRIAANLETTKVRCDGLSFQGTLEPMAEDAAIWHSWRVACPEIRKHQYLFLDDGSNFVITHSNCAGTCEPSLLGERNVCGACLSLIKSVKQSILRCSLKRFAARLLFARLFQEAAVADDLVKEMKAGFLYGRHFAQFDKVLKLENFELQSWIRASFMSVRKDRRSPALSTFLSPIVEPGLSVNVVAAVGQKSMYLRAQACFERYLHQPNESEMDQLSLSIAEASLTGRLQGNPLVMGLVLTSLRVLEREEKGLDPTKGRIAAGSAMGTATAQELALEAGRMLCLAGGNQQLLESFGCSRRPFRGEQYSASLRKAALPVPFLALSDSEQLVSNLKLIDNRFSSMSGQVGCAIDEGG